MTVRAVLDRNLTAHGSRQIDLTLAGVLLVTDVVGIFVALARGDLDPARAVVLVLLAMACAAGFARWRRSRPLMLVPAVFVAVIVGNAAIERGLTSQRSAMQIALLSYALGSWSSRRRTGAAVVLVTSALVAVSAAHDSRNWPGAAAAAVAVLIAPWLAGATARMRRIHLADVEEQLIRADLERDARAREAVRDERSRIARELHDVVAHHVSLIGVQAGAARTTLAEGDDRTRTALTGIESSSRDAVREMRRLIDVLDPINDTPLIAPPRRAEIEALCEGFAAAGLVVERSLDPDLDHLDPAVGLTTYRIVEEALTNITRHSTAKACTVEVTLRDDGLHIVVVDPGPSQLRAPIPPPGAGRGLTGMRERVTLFGGQLSVGPRDRGFVVEATLPIRAR